MMVTPTCIPSRSVERLPFNSVVDRNTRVIHGCVSCVRSMKSAHAAQEASKGTEAAAVTDPSLETPCHNWEGNSGDSGGHAHIPLLGALPASALHLPTHRSLQPHFRNRQLSVASLGRRVFELKRSLF